MELHNLQPAKGSTHSDKRIGRGQGSGFGGTSTRGHKGAKSRSGYSRKVGFQGGQMPLQRLVPKYGFKNINRVEYKGVNLGSLQAVADKYDTTTIPIHNNNNDNHEKRNKNYTNVDPKYDACFLKWLRMKT